MNQTKNNIISISLFIILTGVFIYSVFIPSVRKANTDFPNYYVSSNMYLDGKDMKTAYDNAEFNRQLLIYGINDRIVSYTPYPPLTALIMLPAARLAPLEAKLWWNIFNLFVLTACIVILAKISKLDFIKCGIIFFLSGFALANNFMFGQVYLPVLLFLLISVYFMQQDKDILSALFMALSIVLKFYTIFFIFLFIFQKRYKLLVFTVIFSLLVYIPVVLLTGFDLNVFYFTRIMPRLGDGWVGTVYAAEYQSFISLLHRWFSYEPALNPYPVIQSTLLFYIFKYIYIFSVLTFSILYIKPVKENLMLMVSLFCIVSLLLLPVNASYQYVLLIPAVVFMVEYFTGRKKYAAAGLIIAAMLLINSPLQVWITNRLKDTPFYLFAYVKLFGLLFIWIVNLIILGRLHDIKFFNQRMRKFFAIAAIHIIFLSTLSYYSNPLIADSSGLVNTGNNYMISMPSAYGNKLLWTECINDKFVLRSNFGFEYDKENVFYPVLSDSGYVLFETIENKIPLQKSIDINMGILLDRAEIKLNDGSYNKDKTKRVYSAEGILYIEDLQTGEKHHLTKGKQMCYFPVFADSDSSVIFCSDRNRGVSFTALYKMKIK